MKDSSITPQELDCKIRNIVLRTSKKIKKSPSDKDASRYSVLASPSTSKLPIGVNFISRKYKKKLAYLIVYHYFPLEVSVNCYMKIDLPEFLFEEDQSFWLSVLMDKDLFLKYLCSQKIMTEQQFFSGICNISKLEEAIQFIVLRFEGHLRKPKRVQRRKGYNDKGTLPARDFKILQEELRNDFYLSYEQFLKEEYQDTKHKECQLLIDYLNEGRVLTDEYLVKFKIIKEDKTYEQSNNYSRVKTFNRERATFEHQEEDSEPRNTI